MACKDNNQNKEIECRRMSNPRKSSTVTKEHFLEHKKALQNCKHLILKYGSGENDAMDVYHKEESVGIPIIAYIHQNVAVDEETLPHTVFVPLIVDRGYRALVMTFKSVECEEDRTKNNQKLKEARSYMLKYARNTFAKHISIIVHTSAAQLLLKMLDASLLDEPDAHLIDGITIAPDPNLNSISKGDVLFDTDSKESVPTSQNTKPPTYPNDLSHLRNLPMSICIYARDLSNVSYAGIKSNLDLNQPNQAQELNCLLRRSGAQTEFHLLNIENNNGCRKINNAHLAIYKQFDFQPILNVLNKMEEKLMPKCRS